jgi:iron(III) transport system permease protein
LILKVGILSATIGFMLAYIITFYDIKYKKLINLLLVIPLGIPVYVAAFTYTNVFHFIPFIETILRSELFMNGAVFIYSFFLYPYVYIASKSYLNKNLTDYIEASETLGDSKVRTFIRVILPMSRPIIIGSVVFVLFESLSDFAVVEYYGVLSLSRYINLAWFTNGDFTSAARFSVYIMFIMFFLLFVERIQRRNKRYSSGDIIHRKIKQEKPTIGKGIFIYGFIGIVITLSIILPIGQMIISAVNNLDVISSLDILEITSNSLMITFISVVFIVVAALLLTTITIYTKGIKKQLLSSISTIGYMVPSMVLALGLYMTYIRIDQWLYRTFSGVGLNRMLITSSIIILIIGFFVKFFSIAYTNLLTAYGKVGKTTLEASETLGENKTTTLVRVTIPMLKKSIIAVSIILFIDMFKELTIVYRLRPCNFKTLSTEVYRYAGNEAINIAAFPSLIIIFICAVLIVYLEGGFKK